MWAEKKLGSLFKGFDVCFRPYPPVEALPNGVAHWLTKQPIAIAAGACIKTRMETCVHHPCFLNSQIGRQCGIQRADEFLVRVGPVKVKRSNLTRRMNACIRPPG